MKQRDIAAVLLLTAALAGCDTLKEKLPFLGKKKEAAPAVARRPATPTPAPAADTTPPPAPAPTVKPAVKKSSVPAVDEPWSPTDTGTVNPGMTREQVVAVWGVPVAERTRDNWGYLYFRNGCEASCGTFDVVFLEKGQVVDAVVRGPGHTYSGNSSSPAGRKPEATGSGTLSVPAPAPAPAPSDSQPKPAAPAPSGNQTR
jgi:hypothetical protein